MRNESGGAAERPRARLIPERIKEAREGRGFTLDTFAEALGVTRQAVAQYENGQIAPSGDVLGRIISETAQPLSFFTSVPARAGELRAPFWRSLKRMEQHHRRRIARRLQWAADICALVERFVELPSVDFPVIAFDPDVADEEDIERAAEATRDHWGLGRGPIRDLAALLERKGAIIVREPVACEAMDAVSCWIYARPFVLLSEEVISGPRDIYNLAHELGHVILHATVDLNSDNLDRIEKQANRFASAFLLPRESFSNEVLGSSLGYFETLKRRWGVSIAAMAYRCKDLDIFTDNQFSYLFKQMNWKRIRKVEPLDDAFPVNTPSVLADSMRMLVEHGVYTREQIEGSLALNLADVESLCGVPRGYLDNRVVRLQLKREFGPESIA
ncbi:XRE family transcriptional regulator [Phenylobacterium sp.]|uniref:helix-turn-helix domain-containing protein n=1 Tax=Phenylobacterium sp. TaxID=1871053 RepID=UPI00301BAF77